MQPRHKIGAKSQINNNDQYTYGKIRAKSRDIRMLLAISKK